MEWETRYYLFELSTGLQLHVGQYDTGEWYWYCEDEKGHPFAECGAIHFETAEAAKQAAEQTVLGAESFDALNS